MKGEIFKTDAEIGRTKGVSIERTKAGFIIRIEGEAAKDLAKLKQAIITPTDKATPLFGSLVLIDSLVVKSIGDGNHFAAIDTDGAFSDSAGASFSSACASCPLAKTVEQQAKTIADLALAKVGKVESAD